MVLVQNNTIRQVTLKEVAFLYNLPTNSTPSKNISAIFQLYRTQLRIYRRFDTTYRLTDKFRRNYRKNHQAITHLLSLLTKKHQVPPSAFSLRQITNYPIPFHPKTLISSKNAFFFLCCVLNVVKLYCHDSSSSNLFLRISLTFTKYFTASL